MATEHIEWRSPSEYRYGRPGTVYRVEDGLPVQRRRHGDAVWRDCDERDLAFWKYRNKPHRIEDLPIASDEDFTHFDQLEASLGPMVVPIYWQQPKFSIGNPPGCVIPRATKSNEDRASEVP